MVRNYFANPVEIENEKNIRLRIEKKLECTVENTDNRKKMNNWKRKKSRQPINPNCRLRHNLGSQKF